MIESRYPIILELLLLLLLVLELSVVLIDRVREFTMDSLPGGGHRLSISYFNQCPLLYNIFIDRSRQPILCFQVNRGNSVGVWFARGLGFWAGVWIDIDAVISWGSWSRYGSSIRG